MIQTHRTVSGADGIGSQIPMKRDNGYLYVTVEDSVRGLHLDGLDTVIVIGRPFGPDEYTHIAGRTGRAGKVGNVINVLSKDESWKLNGWEAMLNVPFMNLDEVGYQDLLFKDS